MLAIAPCIPKIFEISGMVDDGGRWLMKQVLVATSSWLLGFLR